MTPNERGRALRRAFLGRGGQAMVGVVLMMIVLAIMVPAMVWWVQQESKATMGNSRTSMAFSLAQAAVGRGIWKCQSSTGTWADALAGTSIKDYEFDATFNDIPGGYYRVQISSGPLVNEATIVGEGKDSSGTQVRAIKEVVKDGTIPGALFSGGAITYSPDFQVQWGPIVSQSSITVTVPDADGGIIPQKFSRQEVTGTGSGVSARDTWGLAPPNTDGVEWWSDYDVPDMPTLDFTTMRSSASATGTLNRCTSQSGSTCEFNNSYGTTSWSANDIWYWDASITTPPCSSASPCTTVQFTGNGGIEGQVIVRGNADFDTSEELVYVATMPAGAWEEYQKCDTSATEEYPGDLGLHDSAATYQLENSSPYGWNASGCYKSTDLPGGTHVMIHGFVYIGGNCNFTLHSKFHGALWIVGSVTHSTADSSGHTIVLYDSDLTDIPTLTVILIRESWEEQSPSSTAWASPL